MASDLLAGGHRTDFTAQRESQPHTKQKVERWVTQRWYNTPVA